VGFWGWVCDSPLKDTDWYLMREVDQPQSYPPEVREKRTRLREEINAIEVSENLQQIELFTSDFS
jgi:hypothetical protein